MSDSYVLQQAPFVVPTTDGKLIEEHVGRAVSNEPEVSVAHMVAPPGWSEPHQNPEFDEYTMMVRGRKKIEIDGEVSEVVFSEVQGEEAARIYTGLADAWSSYRMYQRNIVRDIPVFRVTTLTPP